jgi:hypothetical protein
MTGSKTSKAKTATSAKTEPNTRACTPTNLPTLVIDSREEIPFQFPAVFPTKIAHLRTGDYSVLGLENQMTIERKSADDLYRTLVGEGARRWTRFRRQLCRMSQMELSAVVVTASYDYCMDRALSLGGRDGQKTFKQRVRELMFPYLLTSGTAGYNWPGVQIVWAGNCATATMITCEALYYGWRRLNVCK